MKRRPSIIVIFASAVLIFAVAVALLGNIFTFFIAELRCFLFRAHLVLYILVRD